ncbi:MAG: glycosyl transferase family 2 [Paracoccus sp.]|uniref:glycosyltransferase family 2 protein n=1 Tax=unclassified Paracoccus (in: a-proteobacteria) TaxID=2688777 RepID=UPI000C666143|nr:MULTISPECIES: glycosyltransferase family 2 protein [unclassified Paracoccus (in: a-proteobacteria)]MAN57384.1 glycosyl transferase family 2 [Paracoccus sp. (in: a-proteobacteria)]MDB2490274.1 glycosyltransferase family 2 protein [Paracoccus sp. (in: a-proteobacteria)]|tara:strand:+ start:10586 stop:11725 length:1140 start_codon:yes stop_codon:yes gene_type:complete
MAKAARHDGRVWQLWLRYRLRWKRRELLWRAIRAGRRLSPVADRSAGIRRGDILCLATIRNEAARLPRFLAHYRGLGVAHFLIVDNDSDDGSAEFLRIQGDVSLWRARGSYREARFGLDWVNALLFRHGRGHWCVTADADEFLIYPDWEERDLHALTAHLDASGIEAMGALMLDLYPQGALGRADAPEDAPLWLRLPYFDGGPYRCRTIQPRRNRWVQGGARERAFFATDPARSPTLNKLPLVRWRAGRVYVNSTHSMLPPRLNDAWDGPGDPRLSGVLLHGKFLPDILARSAEELTRRQHFRDPHAYAAYHRAITEAPVLWHEGSRRFAGWRQLLDLGLMGAGEWLSGGERPCQTRSEASLQAITDINTRQPGRPNQQ